MKSRTKLALLLAPMIGLAIGCETKGPAEKAGESIDRGLDNAKDAVTPDGPAEQAGEKLDKAVNP